MTIGMYIATTILISVLMMIGYYINSKFFPKLAKIMDEKISMEDKKRILSNAPSSALYSVGLIHIISEIIGCAIFSYFASNDTDNTYLLIFQVVILVQFIIGEYFNQKEIPHPDWYKYIGYLSWLLSG